MRRVPIVDIVSPRATSDESKSLRISDEDIDKIFNSNCGAFEEVKKSDLKQKETNKSPPKVVPVVETAKEEKKEIKPNPQKDKIVVETPKPQPSSSAPKIIESVVSETKIVKEIEPKQQDTVTAKEPMVKPVEVRYF